MRALLGLLLLATACTDVPYGPTTTTTTTSTSSTLLPCCDLAHPGRDCTCEGDCAMQWPCTSTSTVSTSTLPTTESRASWPGCPPVCVTTTATTEPDGS